MLRTGVAGGVLSTLVVAGSSAPATAAGTTAVHADTVELPAIKTSPAVAAAEAAEATRTAALHYELADARARAADRAQQWAEAHAEKAAAEAEKRRKAEEAARKAAEERAAERTARSAERTTTTAAPSATGTSTTAGPAATGNAAALVSFLRAQVGKSYVLGATGPSAYDCSGLTSAAFRTVGIDLPRTSQSQSVTGTQVSLGALRPGDILCWGGAGSAYHVAVYIGGGKFIGAQNPSTGVVERDLSWDRPSGAVRVL